MAIITRCFIPPESSCGYCSIRRSGSGIPTSRSRSVARAHASAFDAPRCFRIDSATCHPHRNTGFRLVIGSWKIIATSFPRKSGIRSMAMAARSIGSSPPYHQIDPPTIRPCCSGISRRIEYAVTDFPEPDSPTTPSAWPRRISRSTPSTALTMPVSRWKYVFRPWMRRRRWGSGGGAREGERGRHREGGGIGRALIGASNRAWGRTPPGPPPPP